MSLKLQNDYQSHSSYQVNFIPLSFINSCSLLSLTFSLHLTSITMHSHLLSIALVYTSDSNKCINIPPLSLTKYPVLLINYRVSLLINLTIHMLNSWNYSLKSWPPLVIVICSWLNYWLWNVTTSSIHPLPCDCSIPSRGGVKVPSLDLGLSHLASFSQGNVCRCD